MLAFRQIIEDPLDVIPVPPELRHRPTEVIFMALEAEGFKAQERSLNELAGCREDDAHSALAPVEALIVDEGGVWVAQVAADGDLEGAISNMRGQRIVGLFSAAER